MHTVLGCIRHGVLLAVCRGEFGVICVAIEIAIPACLQTNGVGIQNLELHLVEFAVLPDGGGVAVGALLDVSLLIDVEDVVLMCTASVSKTIALYSPPPLFRLTSSRRYDNNIPLMCRSVCMRLSK